VLAIINSKIKQLIVAMTEKSRAPIKKVSNCIKEVETGNAAPVTSP